MGARRVLPIIRGIDPDAAKRVYRNFFPYVTRFKKQLLLALGSGVVVMAMDLLKPWPLKIIFDGILFENQSVRTSPLLSWLFDGGIPWVLAVTCISIVLIAVLHGTFSYSQEILTADVGHRTTASIRRRLYDHLQRLSKSFHDSRKTGDLLVRLTGDIAILKEMLIDFVIIATGQLLALIGMIVVMLVIDWKLTLMALLTVPALMMSIARYTREIRFATNRARHKEGKVASFSYEALNSISLIQALSLERLQYEKFSVYNRSNLRAGLRSVRLVASFQRIVEFLLAAGSCVVMWFGVRRVLDGILSPGDLLVFSSYMRDMYRPLRRLSKLTSRVAKATACGERILEILDREPLIKDAPHAVSAPPLGGRIRFDRVCFSYNGKEQILREASFVIEPGQTVGLVGASGVGKTTIVSLLLRFYEPQSGIITIDEHDIRHLSLESLRRQVSVIMHEPYLFATTIAENIAMGKPEARMEEIVSAAKAANAHDFIVSMENGYDTVVGESGCTLSRGQKQRIALARTAIRDAAILVLDEPTTGLDAESESLVIDALDRLMEGKTCIIIAHRLATIASLGRILVLEGGRIIEDGDHEELMQTSTRYREFFTMQVRTRGGSTAEGGNP